MSFFKEARSKKRIARKKRKDNKEVGGEREG
jgi:hypothetical protein